MPVIPLVVAAKIGWTAYRWFTWLKTAVFTITVTEKIKETLQPVPEGASIFQQVLDTFTLSMRVTSWGILKVLFFAYLGLQIGSFGYLLLQSDYATKMAAAGKEVEWCNSRPADLPPSPECAVIGQWAQRWLNYEYPYAFYYAFNTLQWCGTSSCFAIMLRVPGDAIALFFQPAMFTLFATIATLFVYNFKRIRQFQLEVTAAPARQRVEVAARTLLSLTPIPTTPDAQQQHDNNDIIHLSTDNKAASAAATPLLLKPDTMYHAPWVQQAMRVK